MIFQQMKLGEQVFRAHLPTQQASTPLITFPSFRIRKQNPEAMRKYTEAFSTTLLTFEIDKRDSSCLMMGKTR